MSVTQYSGLSKIYFDAVLKKIINIGQLRNEGITILDFGCGNGRLKQLIGDAVINFDKRQDLSEVNDWKDIEFNYFIANHVLYELEESELHQLCSELKKYFLERQLVIIVGIAKQGLLSKLGKFILNRKEAHQDTKISPSQQVKILKSYFKIRKSINFWSLTQIILITELN
jgi:hypothetical protein